VAEKPEEPEPVLPQGDPHLVLAMAAVEGAVVAARQGSLPAVLDLAFSPVVHQAMGAVGLAPEVVLDMVVPPRHQETPRVLVTNDERAVLAAAAEAPGPIFDIRPWHDGHMAELATSPWYIPLSRPVGPARVRMLRRVLRLTRQAYGLGNLHEWKGVLARIEEAQAELLCLSGARRANGVHQRRAGGRV